MRMISKLVYFSPAIAYFAAVFVQTTILYWMSARIEVVFLILIGLLMGGATMLLVLSIEAEKHKRRLQYVMDRIKEEHPDATVYASETAMIYPRSYAEFKEEFDAKWDDSLEDLWDEEEESETDEPSVEMPDNRFDKDMS